MKKLTKWKFVFYFSLTSLVLVLISSSSAILILRKINQPLIIHYSYLNGIDKVGGIFMVFQIAVLVLVMVLINSFIAYYVESKDKFLGKLISSGTLFLSFLIFIFFFIIISIN
ncbi:MAG: hypothetical protein M1334_02275 [Patescibacteria group bacterium]|nr:hypothetical protein [Patescibacteria group bacterium]